MDIPRPPRDRSPRSAEVIESVRTEYGFVEPRLGQLQNSNPTVFASGSGRFNGRMVFTRGILKPLEDAEAASVIAHEFAHVTSRDFVTMTLPNTNV